MPCRQRVWLCVVDHGFFCRAGAVGGSRLAAPVAVLYGDKEADGVAEATRLITCFVVSGEAVEVARLIARVIMRGAVKVALFFGWKRPHCHRQDARASPWLAGVVAALIERQEGS